MKEITVNNIDKYEVARYLGYKDTLPDVEMTKIILECEQTMLKTIKPKYIYRIFDIEQIDEGVKIVGTQLVLTGEAIKKHLKGCTKAALMCTTLSSGVDMLIRSVEVNNMIKTLVYDALANVTIEQVCDEVEKIIEEDLPEYYHTWRFGIGYGDLPLSLQDKFLSVLNAQKTIGVCSTESCILTPKKSVTCILGLSKEKMENIKKSCDNCNMKEKCQFRKNGTTCN